MLTVDRPRRPDRFAGVAADPGYGGLVQLDVADPGQRELFERGAAADEVADKVVGRIGEDLLRSVVLHDLGAGPQDGDLVAELDRFVEVVSHEDDGLAKLLLQAQQLILQPLSGDRVDRAERLIHQKHGRVGGQRACDPDALLLATGQLAGIAVAVLSGVKADQVKQLVDGPVDPFLVPLE